MDVFGALLARSRFYRNQVDHPEFLKLKSLLESLLQQAKKTANVPLVRTLFVGLAHVRDIDGGRGERVLTYMMLDVWYQVLPVMAVVALEGLLTLGYGSWRDVKGLSRYLRQHSIRKLSPQEPDHPLIVTAVELMLRHLTEPGVAKWVPRESCRKWNWLFDLFVLQRFGHVTSERKRQFRRTVSDLSCGGGVKAAQRTLEPRPSLGGALEKWIGRSAADDAAWKRFASGLKPGGFHFPPQLFYNPERDRIVPVLYLTPEMFLRRDLTHYAVAETLLAVEGLPSPSSLVVLATQPPRSVWIEPGCGLAYNSQLLLNTLAQFPSCTMNLDAGIKHAGSCANCPGLVVLPIISPGRTPVCLSTVTKHKRYEPMVARFNAVVD
jgi:hypothetical protein